MKKTFLASSLAVLILIGLCVFAPYTIHPEIAQEPKLENPKFVISSWDYPDAYGQGIERFTILENSSGTWTVDQLSYYNESGVIEWNASLFCKLIIACFINITFLGISTENEATNRTQLNVTVVNNRGVTEFSQQNLTYIADTYNDEGDGVYLLGYQVVLNFSPKLGGIYTITVNMELYY